MNEQKTAADLDRHALVLAVWLPAGFVSLASFHFGFGAGGSWWLAGGFAAILVGFIAHVIINAVLGTGFSRREVALALVLFLVAALAFVLACLVVDSFAARNFLVIAFGMAGLVAAAVFYMVTAYGTRGAFEAFDISRDNNPRQASRLSHRGGRR